MKGSYVKTQAQKALFLSLTGIGILIIFSTFLGHEIVKFVTDFTYIAISGILVILSILLNLRFRSTGKHGKAWLFFLGTAASWCIAETLWTVYELFYNVDPFPSIADVFYLGGYPFLFCFLSYYLKPVSRALTSKTVKSSIIIAISLAAPSIYMAYDFNSKVPFFENALSVSYPILDAIVFVPAAIGVVLFFRGEVNFTWSLICIGIILFSIGDTMFQVSEYTDTYYTGYPSDIMLLWAYVLFSFGVYDHIQIFKKSKHNKMMEQN